MGPYLYDVRTEGGGGVPSKADIVIKLTYISLYLTTNFKYTIHKTRRK